MVVKIFIKPIKNTTTIKNGNPILEATPPCSYFVANGMGGWGWGRVEKSIATSWRTETLNVSEVQFFLRSVTSLCQSKQAQYLLNTANYEWTNSWPDRTEMNSQSNKNNHTRNNALRGKRFAQLFMKVCMTHVSYLCGWNSDRKGRLLAPIFIGRALTFSQPSSERARCLSKSEPPRQVQNNNYFRNGVRPRSRVDSEVILRYLVILNF